jgi:hypothetical protein
MARKRNVVHTIQETSIIYTVQGINIEDVPTEFEDEIWPKLSTNGGNCLSVYRSTAFGQWLETQGFDFEGKSWAWLVVWR